MPLLLPVLVRGINNLSDARYCAGMGADGLIFTLDPSLPGAVTPATVKELAGWVSGVELIGEFGNMTSEAINALVAECGLSRVLLRAPGPSPFLPPNPSRLAVPALAPTLWATLLDPIYHAVAEVLRAAYPPGSGVWTDLPLAEHLAHPKLRALTAAAAQFPLWLGGLLMADDVEELLAMCKPTGLILEGDDEIKPGLRDFTELEAIFEALEAD